MLNEASPEPARPVIRPCRPSVHPSRGRVRRGGAGQQGGAAGVGGGGTDGGTDTCALGTGHTLVYMYITQEMLNLDSEILIFQSCYIYGWALNAYI